MNVVIFANRLFGFVHHLNDARKPLIILLGAPFSSRSRMMLRKFVVATAFVMPSYLLGEGLYRFKGEI